jgi:hypothetical protein
MNSDTADLIRSIVSLGTIARRARELVYPAFMAFNIKRLVKSFDGSETDGVTFTPGDVETLGSGRYAMEVTASNGPRYRITVEAI